MTTNMFEYEGLTFETFEEYEAALSILVGASAERIARYVQYQAYGIPLSEWEARYTLDEEHESAFTRSRGEGGVRFDGRRAPDADWTRWIDALVERDYIAAQDRDAALHAESIKGIPCANCGSSSGFIFRHRAGDRPFASCFSGRCRPWDVGVRLEVIREIWPMPNTTPPLDEDPYKRLVVVEVDPALARFDRTNLGDAHLGARVAKEYLEGEVVAWGRSAWSRWDGRRWAKTTDTDVFEAVRRALLDIHAVETAAANTRLEATLDEIRHRDYDTDADRQQAARHATEAHGRRMKALGGLFHAGKIASVMKVARGLLEVRQEIFDSHADLLNVANGVVDLRTGELRRHDPGLYFTKVSEVAYRPGAEHPDWNKALTALPEDVRDWMQVRFGQAATGYSTTDDVVPFLKGGGANGKSTILTGVDKALGDFAVVVPDKVLLASPSDHPTELMTLFGARLAFIEELPEGDYLNAQRLKKAVGTEAMTARYIGQDNVVWSATHSLMVTTNYDVHVDAVDHGTWRRLALVAFPFTFDGTDPDHPKDPTLRDRVKNDPKVHEAALAWVVEGARHWYAADRRIPDAPERVKADTASWRYESNHAARFIDEMLEPDPESAVRSIDVYRLFKVWASEHGLRPWSDRLFWSRARQHEWFRTGEVEKPESVVRTSTWKVSVPPGVAVRERERLVTGLRLTAEAVERLMFL